MIKKNLLIAISLFFFGFANAQTSPYCNTQIFHLGIPAEVASSILVTIENTSSTTMDVEIESANADAVDLLIVTNGSGAAISPEDFSTPGKIKRTLTWVTPPSNVNLNVLWSKVSFGGNWQLSPADFSIPFAAVCSGAAPKTQIDLPVTFEDTATVDYTLTDFGGNVSMVVTDPTDPNNIVAMSDKTAAAQVWAGTTMGAGTLGFINAIPLTASATSMTVRVWSPDAGIPVRLKIEDETNPGISVETEALTTVASTWETLTFDFSNEAPGTAALNLANTYDKASIFFNFGTDGATAGAKTYYWDDVEFVSGGGGLSQIDVPVTFDDNTVNYTMTDFGGNVSSVVVDPTNASNMVGKADKTISAQLWAGTTMGDTSGTGFANPLPFSVGNTIMTVRVWSPDAGTPIRLKVEDSSDPTKSVEAEVLTTMAATWEMLTFDFTNQAAGTAAINFGFTYDKASIFFNFGTDGATAGAKTYYWDDVEFGTGGGNPLTQIDLPVTFEDSTVDYSVVDFGGAVTMIVVDPTNASNTVGQTEKTSGAQTFAGTTMGAASGTGFINPVPFSVGNTTMSVRVWSPDAGIQVRLKVEDATNATISVETEATTLVASAWDTLFFDFSNEAPGTAAINFANTYDKASIFFDFGANGATPSKTYYWDDCQFGGSGGSSLAQIDLPVTFEDTAVDYSLTDFAGSISVLTADPLNASNTVAQTEKTDSALTFAGTTMGPASGTGFANEVPFSVGNTIMSVLVYSPDAGTPVRLKVEDAGNGAISVETEALTTVANAWDTLFFDFASPVSGTPSINFANTYDKATIFFNFGTDGATAGSKTYYWDNVEFVGGGVNPLAQIDLPVTFEDTATDYSLVDFGGNVTVLDVDPVMGTNTVAKSTRTAGSQTFAGTTIGTTAGFANAVPFTTTETRMSAKVYSPAANIPVRLKVEDATNGGISVETEALTTVAGAWEVLVFDFSNEVVGTAALNLANTYDKASIFFNFGVDGATAGEQIYYWDDVEFGVQVGINSAFEAGFKFYPNPNNGLIRFDSERVVSDIKIFDLLGREINVADSYKESQLIDVTELTQGTYFMRVNLEGEVSTFKFIRQ